MSMWWHVYKGYSDTFGGDATVTMAESTVDPKEAVESVLNVTIGGGERASYWKSFDHEPTDEELEWSPEDPK